MTKEEIHKKIEATVSKGMTIIKAYEKVSKMSGHGLFMRESYYRRWKFDRGIKTQHKGKCKRCGVIFNSKIHNQVYCEQHKGGRSGPLNRITKRAGVKLSSVYNVWVGMRHRCLNSTNINYHNYGGRGISICDEWLNSFVKFELWCFFNGYEKGLQIDRVNNNGNYEPSNCRFTTRDVNCSNTRISSSNTSGYKGVCKSTNSKNFRSSITIKGQRINLGSHKTKKEAALARDLYIIINKLPHTKNMVWG